MDSLVDSSFQNGPVERAHCTIATSTEALLFGAALDFKFWSYVLCGQPCYPNKDCFVTSSSSSFSYPLSNWKEILPNSKLSVF